MTRLGVNIDHVATVRNARGSFHPDPFTIAKHVTKCGAHSVTCLAIVKGSGWNDPLAFLIVAT